MLKKTLTPKKNPIKGIPLIAIKNDHFLSSIIAAHIVFLWINNECQWISKSEFPFHPYDFVC